MLKSALTSIILLLCCSVIPTQVKAAVSFSVSGDVAFDKGSITLEIDITGISISDLKPGGSATDYKQNLRVFLTSVSSDTPLRTTVGSNTLSDYVNDFYWDLSNSSVTIVNQTSTEYDLKYIVNVYENKSFLNYDTLESLLDSSTPETLGLEVGFWAYKSDGTFEKRSQSTGFNIAVNYAAINNTVSLTSVSPINKGIRVSWPATESVTYTDSVARSAPEVLLTVFRNNGSNIDLSSASFLADLTGATGDTQSGSCIIDSSLVDGSTTCVTDCTTDATEVIYLDETAMGNLKSDGDLIYSALQDTSKTSLELTGLDVGESYAVFLQYKRGNSPSLCLSTTVRENTTLTELNGEDDAKLENPNCFIATAAFGSPLNQHVDTFRWFRNNFLLTNDIGNKFVKAYYKYSPPVADIISNSKPLKLLSIAALYPAYIGIKSVQTFGFPLSMVFLLITVTLLAMFSKHLILRR